MQPVKRQPKGHAKYGLLMQVVFIVYTALDRQDYFVTVTRDSDRPRLQSPDNLKGIQDVQPQETFHPEMFRLILRGETSHAFVCF